MYYIYYIIIYRSYTHDTIVAIVYIKQQEEQVMTKDHNTTLKTGNNTTVIKLIYLFWISEPGGGVIKVA